MICLQSAISKIAGHRSVFQSGVSLITSTSVASTFVFLTSFVTLIMVFSGCQPETTMRYGHENSEDRHYDKYEELPPAEELYQKIYKSSGQQQRLRQQLDQQFAKFAQAIGRYVKDGDAGKTGKIASSGWINESFAGEGVEWNKLKDRFNDASTNIRRWQASDSSPKFENEDAFAQFVTEYFDRWVSSKDFRIDIKPYSIRVLDKFKGGKIESNVVVEVFGNTADQTGIQATAFWTTQWTSEKTDAFKSI